MSINSRISQVLERIQQAASAVSRTPDDIQLIAVSKTQPLEAITEAYAAGIRNFGESYLQEALSKIGKIELPDISWHFIGPIQSNKTLAIAEHFDWVHSIDREKIAQRLDEQRPTRLPSLQVCIQVNISGEASKSGVDTNQVEALANVIRSCRQLELRGLMGIPQPTDNYDEQLDAFKKLATIQSDLIRKGYELDTLSMGMSNDLEAAINAGSNMVRIGTAIFGNRQ